MSFPSMDEVGLLGHVLSVDLIDTPYVHILSSFLHLLSWSWKRILLKRLGYMAWEQRRLGVHHPHPRMIPTSSTVG
jgi:hypothetical protein